MGKCIKCGKKGLFLKVDSQGRCSHCAELIAAEQAKRNELENAEFEAYYANLLLNLKHIKEDIFIDKDPIAAVSFIPQIEAKVDLCNTLQTEIHTKKHEERLINKLTNLITYRDDFSKRHGIGFLDEWGISVFFDPITKKYSGEKLLKDLDKAVNSYKHQWVKSIKRIQANAEFQKELDQIPSVNLEISDSVFKKQSVSDLNELVKYTGITPKTNFDKLGSFVVIDVETTGLSSMKDNLLEVAAIKFEDWTPVEKFQTLLNPGRHIPDDASEVNNITDDMVASSPTFSQIVNCLSSFIGKSNIVGHNLPFDLKFLYRHGYNFTEEKRRYYDTCEIAKKTLKKPKMKWDKEWGEYVVNDNYDYDVEDYKLTTLCDYYRIRDNSSAHRALSDALATGLLFKCLAQDKIED